MDNAQRTDLKHFEIEVELLILAYHAFIKACSQREIQTLLSYIKKRTLVWVGVARKGYNGSKK